MVGDRRRRGPACLFNERLFEIFIITHGALSPTIAFNYTTSSNLWPPLTCPAASLAWEKLTRKAGIVSNLYFHFCQLKAATYTAYTKMCIYCMHTYMHALQSVWFARECLSTVVLT